jgi:tetratricopeptide (TPR) repeat protein
MSPIPERAIAMNAPDIKVILDKAERQIQSGYNPRETIALLTPLVENLRRSGQTDDLVRALVNTGVCFFDAGDLAGARAYQEEALKIARASSNQAWLASCLHELSLVALREGKLQESFDLSSEALGAGLEAENDVGNIILQLTVLYQLLGKFAEAEEMLTVVRANCERDSDVLLLARILNELGMVKFELGKYPEGIQSLVDAIHYKKILGDVRGIQKTMYVLRTCLMRFPSAMNSPEVQGILRGAAL